MVNGRDLIITGGVLLAVSLAVLQFSQVQLPGTQTGNVLCKLPGTGSLDTCNEIQAGETEFRVDTRFTVSRTTIEEIEYKTVNTDAPVYSATDTDSLAFPAETRDAKLNILVKNDAGEIIASDTRRFGTIVGTDTRQVDFSFRVPREGTYRLESSFVGEGCGLILCAPVTIEERTDLTVPNLPLNEYDTVAVN